jgi:hypothetical protein
VPTFHKFDIYASKVIKAAKSSLKIIYSGSVAQPMVFCVAVRVKTSRKEKPKWNSIRHSQKRSEKKARKINLNHFDGTNNTKKRDENFSCCFVLASKASKKSWKNL